MKDGKARIDERLLFIMECKIISKNFPNTDSAKWYSDYEDHILENRDMTRSEVQRDDEIVIDHLERDMINHAIYRPFNSYHAIYENSNPYNPIAIYINGKKTYLYIRYEHINIRALRNIDERIKKSNYDLYGNYIHFCKGIKIRRKDHFKKIF